MMIRKSPFILLLFLVIFSAFLIECKTQDYTPYDYDGEILVFGKGGGFTGQSIEYSLLSNGQIFSGTQKEGIVDELRRIDKKEVNQIFANYHTFDFNSLDINKPGNTYYYLTFRSEGSDHKIQWGAHDFKTPETLKIYFSNLMAAVKARQINAN